MNRFLFVLALCLGGPAFGQRAPWQPVTLNPVVTASGYTGPGNVVASAKAWHSCTRGYSAAYATGSNNACNLRRKQDNVACDFVIASNGNFGNSTATCNSSTQGGISATAFAGLDAGAGASLSCTNSVITATCTGAASTPIVGSTVVGTGISQPCIVAAVGTFTAGAGTMTIELAGTTTTCGTVSVAETLTLTNALFVTKAYDQTAGNQCASASCDVAQATAGNQPQWLPNCGNSLPCINYSNANSTTLAGANNFTSSGTLTYSTVFDRTGNFTGGAMTVENGSANNRLAGGASSNTIRMLAGAGTVSATANDSTVNLVNAVTNNASSVFNINGTETTVSIGGTNVAGLPAVGTATYIGYIFESGFWDSTTFSGGQRTSMCHNQFLYYASGTSC